MIITITSIHLRKRRYFFKLSWNGFKISRQAAKSAGFVKMKNTGSGYDHYTCSLWKDEASMKAFARSGAHLAAMKQSAQLSDRLSTYSYEGDQMPEWEEAKKLLNEKGKELRF